MPSSHKRAHTTFIGPLRMSYSSNAGERQKVAIVGGGFGGLYTALSLAELDRRTNLLDISLYDPKDKFVFLPLLYELAVGSATASEVSPGYESLLEGSGIKYIQSDVTSIDSVARQICYITKDSSSSSSSSSSATQKVDYDQCVIATGTRPRSALIPGAAEFAIPFYRVSDVEMLQSKLQALKNGESADQNKIRIVVVGAGYSGVEVAVNLAEYLRDSKKGYEIHIVDRNTEVMHTSPAFNRATAQK